MVRHTRFQNFEGDFCRHFFLENGSNHHTVSGLEQLTHRSGNQIVGEDCRGIVYISNHHNIFLDAALVFSSIQQLGCEPPRLVIGKQLYTPMTSWLFNLNHSIPMPRNTKGNGREERREAYKTIKKSLDSGESVWIAQRGGRPYDWDDQTATGVCAKLMEDGVPNIVPVSVTTEKGPTAISLAELYVRRKLKKQTKKKPLGDLRDIGRELFYQKGRMHTHFGTLIHGEGCPEEIAGEVTREIHRNYYLFESHIAAQEALRNPDAYEQLIRGYSPLSRQLEECPEFAQRQLVQMYANIPINHDLAREAS